MFITNNSYQDLQGLCLEYFASPFKLFMNVKTFQVHFSTDVFRSAGKGEIKVYDLCALVLTLLVFDTVLACRSCSAPSCQMGNCMTKSLTLGLWANLVGKIHMVFFSGVPAGSCGYDGSCLLSPARGIPECSSPAVSIPVFHS